MREIKIRSIKKKTMLKVDDIVFLGQDFENSQFHESGHGHETHKVKILEVIVETLLIRYKVEIVDSTNDKSVGQITTIKHGDFVIANNQLNVLFEQLTKSINAKCVNGEFLKHSKEAAFQENDDCIVLSVFDDCLIIPKDFLTNDEIGYLRTNAETFNDFRFMAYWDNDDLGIWLDSILGTTK